MTYSKTPLNLSPEMAELKQNIQSQIQKEKELLEEIHEKSGFLEIISSGTANAFGLLASVTGAILTGFKIVVSEIPIAGFALKMFTVLPAAVATLTDSKKTWGEKIFAMTILATVVALSIASVAVVAVAAGAALAVVKVAVINAAIIGTTVSALMTSLELLKLATLSIEKHNARTALKDKIEFDESIANELIPEGNKFDVQLEVRAIELERKKSKLNLTTEEKENIDKEMQFIQAELLKRSITPGENQDGKAFKLKERYADRDKKLLDIAKMIAAINAAPEGADNKANLDAMRLLQEEILEIDEDIEEITQPIKNVIRRDLVANENIAQSVTTASMALVGVTLSTVGLLLAFGTLAAPPVIGPILIGFGIAMAVISLVTWAAFKIAERNDVKSAELKQETQMENVLDEALDYHEKNQITSTVQPKAGSSYVKLREGLLTPTSTTTQLASSVLLPKPIITITQEQTVTQVKPEVTTTVQPEVTTLTPEIIEEPAVIGQHM